MAATSASLRLLGGFQLSIDGMPVDLRARKCKALLARLALDNGTPRGRDELAALLWPEADFAAARQSLRQALSEIRRTLRHAESCIVATTDNVYLDPQQLDLDTRKFVNCRNGDITQLKSALDLYAGDVLEGFECRVDEFDSWLAEQRLTHRTLAVEFCEAIARHYEDEEITGAAIDGYRRLINLDKTNEAAYRNLMQLYISDDKDNLAIKLYLSCRAVLDRELGVPPEPETTQLYESLLSHRHQDVTNSPTAAPQRRLRPTTIMAIRPTTLGDDPEALDTVWQRIADTAQAVVKRYGGELIHRRANVGIAAFGLDQAHGTEPDRARLAATELMIHEDDLAIALATGQVLYKVDDAEVTGAPLNIAMETAARTPANELWAHRSAAMSLRIPITTLDLGADTFNLLPMQGTLESVPLVGREFQLRQFLTALDTCRDASGGHSLLLRGEAGIGKSRLVREWIRLAQQEDAQVHVTHVLDFGAARGSEPLAQLIRSFCAEEKNAAVALPTQTLERAGVDEALMPFALDTLGQELEPSMQSVVASMDPLTRVGRRAEVIHRLIAHACEQSTVLLIFEDIHWADQLVLAVVSQLVKLITAHPALLVMTTRVEGEPLDPTWRGTMQGAPLTTIDLLPLRKREASMLANRLGLPDAEELIARSGGNPLFLEQLARVAADTEVPDSIQNLAVARLDVLSSDAKETARCASIFGQSFRAEWVEACVGNPAFGELISSGLVQAEDEQYRFHHALIREGIYLNLLQDERHRLHQHAARLFDAKDPVLFAEHLDRANDPGAAAALIEAGQYEQLKNRPALALGYVSRAIESKGLTESRRGAALALASELHITLGDAQSAIGLLDEVAKDDDPAIRARALQRLGMAQNLLDNQTQAISHLQGAIELVPENDEILADAYLELGNAFFPTGNVQACLEAHTASHKHATKLDDHFRASRALGGLADAYYQAGLLRSACASFGESVQLAEDAGYLSIVPANKAMYEYTRMFLNETREAVAGMFEALELAKRNNNLRHVCLCHNVIGVVSPYFGNFDDGLYHAQAGIQVAQQIGSRRFEADCHGQVGHLLWCQGRMDEGRRALETGFELLGQDLIPFGGGYMSALAACCANTIEEMHSYLDQGEQMLAGGAVSHCHLFYYAMGMQACLQFDAMDRALQLAAGLAAYTDREPLPWSDYLIRRTRLLAGTVEDPDKERAALLKIADTAPFALTV